jgi:hypothetical protein
MLLFLLFFTVSLPLMAQAGSQPPEASSSEPDPQLRRRRNQDDALLRAEREMAKRMNKERQVSLQHDTEKLFQLATELKNYVEKTNENTLSVEVIKKAEEIEKLARKVREKMRGDF